MCFDHDSRPPIRPIAGGALDSRELTLTASDGNVLTAFEARAAEPTGASIVVLPDVRGLHTFYFELVLRFAENGIDAVAIDWFGRTAGLGRREDGFDYMPHVEQTTWDGVSADIAAGAAHARSLRPDRASLALHDRLLLRRPDVVLVGHARPGAGRCDRLLRPARRTGPGRLARTGRRRGSDRVADPGHLRRRRRGHSAVCHRDVRRGPRAGRGRAPTHHLPERPAQLLRPQGRRVQARSPNSRGRRFSGSSAPTPEARRPGPQDDQRLARVQAVATRATNTTRASMPARQGRIGRGHHPAERRADGLEGAADEAG